MALLICIFGGLQPCFSSYFSFSLLWGPTNHIKHLFSMERLPFTATYFGTMLATLYFSIWVSLTLSQEFQPMSAQLSKKAVLPLAKIFATCHHNVSNTRTQYCMVQLFFKEQKKCYRKISNIRRTKSPSLNVSRLVLQLSLPNPMKPGVKSRMKM